MRGSVAPPGWTPSPEFAPPPVPVAPASVSEAAHMAVRWRVSAAGIDNLIVYGGYLAACLALHWRVAALTHLLWLSVAGVAYHFVLEARDGQTIGKRRYGIRVVDAEGGPAGPKAIAIRSVLRILDSLPVCYVSGLISMVQTGPARRQRIGDIAAGTMWRPRAARCKRGPRAGCSRLPRWGRWPSRLSPLSVSSRPATSR